MSDPAYFEQVTANPETSTACWPNGEDAAVCHVRRGEEASGLGRIASTRHPFPGLAGVCLWICTFCKSSWPTNRANVPALCHLWGDALRRVADMAGDLMNGLRSETSAEDQRVAPLFKGEAMGRKKTSTPIRYVTDEKRLV